MPVTVRTYTTGANWTSTSFFTMLRNAFRDLNYFPASNRPVGLATWTLATSSTVVAQANKEYIVDQLNNSGIDGQTGTRWYITRTSTGSISLLECLDPGTGFKGHSAGTSGTYSQAGTTVTVTRVAHGLPVGRRIWLDFTSGTATDQSAIITSVPNSDTFTCTLTNSVTTSGSVTIYGAAGNYTRSGNIVTLTVENHNIANGALVYFNRISGGATLTLYAFVTVVDANTLQYTDTGSGTTSGSMWAAPCFEIKGSDVGGADGPDDVWVRADSSFASTGITNDWVQYYNSNQGVVWDRVVNPAKVMGKSFTAINMTGNTFFIKDVYSYNMNNFTNQGANYITRSRFGGLNDTNNVSTYTIGSGTVSPITLRVFQSEIDTKFAVFQFSQGTTDYPAFVFHFFTPASTAPYDLDKASQSGFTAFVQLTDGIRIETPGYGTVPAFSAEGRYTNRTTPDVTNGSMRYDFSAPGNNTNPKLYQDIQLPNNTNFGPLVNKIPLNPAAIPTFYVMPDDFGFISTVGASQLRAGDTITASASEVYTAIVSSSSATGITFVARTT